MGYRLNKIMRICALSTHDQRLTIKLHGTTSPLLVRFRENHKQDTSCEPSNMDGTLLDGEIVCGKTYGPNMVFLHAKLTCLRHIWRNLEAIDEIILRVI
jgi:hypothetical protein